MREMRTKNEMRSEAIVPVEMNHIRFYFSQLEKMQKALNNEQMGKLVFAVYRYALTGKREDVDGDILYPYEECCYKIDRNRI